MIIDLAAGIFTAIAGGIINIFGVVNSMRGIYAVGCISMTLMFIIRNYWVEETKIGKEIMSLHRSISFKEKKDDYIKAIKFMFTNPSTLLALFIMILTNFQVAFQFFIAIYLQDVLKLKASMTSIYPGLSAVINLFIFFVFLPSLMKRHVSNGLIKGLAFSIAGYIVFLLARPHGYFILIISIILTATGNMLTTTFRDTLWNSVIGESERAKIFSACQGIISILSIPSGIIAGYSYKSNPAYPFAASIVIFALALVFAIKYNRLKFKINKDINAVL